MNTFNRQYCYAFLGLLLQALSTSLFTQCTSLICEENVTVSMNQACEGTINAYFLIVNQNQCGGPKIIEYFDADGTMLGDTVDGPSYIGQTLDFWAKHTWSNNECWGTVTIVDTKGPQIDCQNLKIKCTEEFDTNSLGIPNAEDNCTAVESMTYTDEVIDFGCGETGFEGYFAPANWIVSTTNGDGGVDVTGAPNSVLAEGAHSSPFNVTPRYITKFKIVIPAEGYISFDWNSFGGSNFNTDAFYITVNGVCIQLSFNDVTSGSYTTWLLQAGDVLSFEQTSDGTYDHVNTIISNFQFLTTTFKIINRTWTATDSWGNTKSCTQVIELQRAALSDVHFPLNRDGIHAPMLGCGEAYEPEITGVPFLDDDGDYATTDDQFDIENNDCTFNLTYADQIIETCPGSELILREWTILDWCSSQVLSEVQVIKRFDEVAPIISNCPQNMTIGIEGSECKATVNLPSATANDDCTGQIEMIPTWTYGTGNQNFTEVDLGIHTVTYTAIDACGNAASCAIEITIIDNQNPIMVCDAFSVAAISSDGTSQISAENLDDGSFDACCFNENSFEIKRKGESDTTFAPALLIDCTNLTAQMMVVVRARDCTGNANTCEIEVKIEDNNAPAISAPYDVTVDCSSSLSNLETYGMPQVFDNCNYILTETNTQNINNCGAGTITRTWIATDLSGNENTATQTIFVENQAPWNANGDQIIWPADYTINGCDINLDPSILPVTVSEPTFDGTESCELVGISHEDEILWFSEPACYLLLRKWTVVDWCQNDLSGNTTEGLWEYTQTIEVTDTEAPIFVNPAAEVLVEINSTANCTANVTLPTPDVADCSNHILFAAFGELGSGFSFSNISAGTYAMTYTAADGCGNSVAHNFNVIVIDSKKPTPICKQGLIVEIEQDANIEISASLFNLFSFDNCTEEGVLKFSFSPDVNEETLLLDCNNLGNTTVEIWVTDEAGNQDLCVNFVTLNDNFDYCQNFGDEGTLTGNVITEFGEAVNQVQISMQDVSMPAVESDGNGTFLFENMPLNSTYTLVPEKNINPVNGVSTYDLVKLHDHILGIESLDSPYQLIAADANYSGTITTLDIITIQRVILTMDDNFTNNTSWRFVPADYEFQNPENPFNENFPEYQTIANISGDMEIGDFIGIKIGDLNGSVNPMNMNTGGGNIFATVDFIESRSSEKLIFNIQDQSFKAGEMVFAEIIVEDIVSLLTWQGTFEFEKNLLELIDIRPNTAQNIQPIFNQVHIENGLLTALWVKRNETLFTPKAIFFTLEFMAKKAGRLSEVLKVSSKRTAALAFNNFDEKMEIELQFEKESSIENEGYYLAQNFPNPVVNHTTIECFLPKDEVIQFEFTNTSGEIFHTVEKDFKKGINLLKISRLDLKVAKGIVFYRMHSTCFSTTKKMIVVD